MGETAAAAVHWNEPAEPTNGELKHPISYRHTSHPEISHLPLLSPDLEADQKALQQMTKGNVQL